MLLFVNVQFQPMIFEIICPFRLLFVCMPVVCPKKEKFYFHNNGYFEIISPDNCRRWEMNFMTNKMSHTKLLNELPEWEPQKRFAWWLEFVLKFLALSQQSMLLANEQLKNLCIAKHAQRIFTSHTLNEVYWAIGRSKCVCAFGYDCVGVDVNEMEK